MEQVEIRWVIIGTVGLYTGQWLTRKDAIEAHTRAWYDGYPANPPDSERQRLWKQCRRRGDRAIQAAISWEVP